MVRASLFIDGKRIADNEFSHITLQQSLGNHSLCEVKVRTDSQKDLISKKVSAWIGKSLHVGFGYIEDKKIASATVPITFRGIITSISLYRQPGADQIVVQGYSPTITLENGPHTRSFSDKTIQEIVDEVLSKYNSFPNSPQVSPALNSKSIPYLVQYQESDFRFLTRISNYYGEWMYYDGLDFYFGKPADKKTVNFNFDEKGLRNFKMAVQLVPGKFEIKGYDYVNHSIFHENNPGSFVSNKIATNSIEISNNNVFLNSPISTISSSIEKEDLKNELVRREQIILDETLIVQGSSHNPSLKIGDSVEIQDTASREKFGCYSIISLTQDISQTGEYHNQFEAIPEELKTPR